jgi:hypothetical protein
VNAPSNTRRFTAYVERHTQVTKLLKRALELWMLTCGLKIEDDWVPLLVLEMQLNAAAKTRQACSQAGEKESRASAMPNSDDERNRAG